MPSPVLIIGCGALGRELVALRRLNGWSHVALRLLPALLHNRPERIAPALAEAIEAGRREFEHVFVAYADCGSRGEIDRVAARYGVERLPGPILDRRRYQRAGGQKRRRQRLRARLQPCAGHPGSR